MGPTAYALVCFSGWYILLSTAMALYRGALIFSGRKQVNSFANDGRDLEGFGQRLTRARDNCFETLPLFAALALAASLAGRLDVTDGLAMWVVYLRIGQSIAHVISTSPVAVQIRAGFFFAQMFIYIWWVLRLL